MPCQGHKQAQGGVTYLHSIELEADRLRAHASVVSDDISDEEVRHKMLAWRGRLGWEITVWVSHSHFSRALPPTLPPIELSQPQWLCHLLRAHRQEPDSKPW